MRTLFLFLAASLAAASCGELSEQGGMRSVAYLPDGRLVVFLEGVTHVTDADGKSVQRTIATHHQIGRYLPLWHRYALSADGSVAAAAASGFVDVFAPATGEHLATFSGLGDVSSIALSPDGGLLAVCSGYYTLGLSPFDPEDLSIWRVSDQTMVAHITHDPQRPMGYWSLALAFSSDGSMLYGGEMTMDPAGPSYLDAWAVSSGERIWESPIDRHEGSAMLVPFVQLLTMAVSPDGTMLATAGNPPEVDLWSALDGTLQGHFPGAPNDDAELSQIVFTSDGKKLVLASMISNNSPLLFDLTGAVVHAWPQANPGGYYSCMAASLSPDGTRMAASCDPYLKVWTADGTLVEQRRFDYAID